MTNFKEKIELEIDKIELKKNYIFISNPSLNLKIIFKFFFVEIQSFLNFEKLLEVIRYFMMYFILIYGHYFINYIIFL